MLAVVARDGSVLRWDFEDHSVPVQEELAREAGAAHECVAWAADGRSLATGGADGIVRLFDLEDPQYQRSRRRMDAGPSTTAVGSARGAPHPLQARRLRGHSREVRCLAFSPGDCRLLVSGSRDTYIIVWCRYSGQRLRGLFGNRFTPDVSFGHFREVTGLAFSPNGACMVSVGEDRKMVLWSTTSWQPLMTVHGHATESNFSCRTHGLCTCQADDIPFPRKDCLAVGHHDIITGVVFSPAGQMVASSSQDATVRIWDYQVSWNPRTFTCDDELTFKMLLSCYSPAMSVAFSPDSSLLAAGCCDGEIRIWNTRTGVVARTLSSASQKIASYPISALCKSQSPSETHHDSSHVSRETFGVKTSAQILVVAFSPSGHHLAATGGFFEDAVQLWDAKKWEWSSLLQCERHSQSATEDLPTSNRGVGVSGIAFDPLDQINRNSRLAFAMGQHERLGASSKVASLEPGLVNLILDYLP